MLLLSTALSALSILNGTVTGFRSINSIRKKLNKKKNNDNNDIPLEEVPLAIEDTIQNQSPISDRRTDSSEMSPENLDQTRNESVAVTDLSDTVGKTGTKSKFWILYFFVLRNSLVFKH